MGSYRYLFKNIGLLTLSSFATKLISFFLVPLYTNILTTTEYGTYDLFNTTIGVLLPILTLNIQEAVMRFAIDNKTSRKAIVTLGARYLLIGTAIVIAALIINSIFSLVDLLETYAIYFLLMFISQALSGVLLAYIRGINRIADLSVSSAMASAITILCNILFLVVFKLGLIGYFLANIIGPLMQDLFLLVRSGAIKEIAFQSEFPNEKQEMLAYCKPMIPNSIAWWVNNTSDRYIVIFFCGIAANGVYSVASKIPSILNIFQAIFNQAWSLSAVQEFDPEDKSGFFSNIYRAYNCMMVIMCSGIIMLDKLLAKFLYAKDFYVAWKYVPWLTIAIVFGALSGHIGGVFTAVKNSKIFARSTMIGAASNIVMNLALTPIMGALGAAIATTICYMIVWAMRYWNAKRYIKLRININRDVISYGILLIQAIILLVISNNTILYGIEIALFVIIAFLYADDVILLAKKLLRR